MFSNGLWLRYWNETKNPLFNNCTSVPHCQTYMCHLTGGIQDQCTVILFWDRHINPIEWACHTGEGAWCNANKWWQKNALFMSFRNTSHVNLSSNTCRSYSLQKRKGGKRKIYPSLLWLTAPATTHTLEEALSLVTRPSAQVWLTELLLYWKVVWRVEFHKSSQVVKG